MKKQKRLSISDRLDAVSKTYVPDNELRDTPSRLFRAILNKLKMNPGKWGALLRNHLEWSINYEDRDVTRDKRTTQAGNIKDTYFQKDTLTFNKFLEGLSIIQMEECEVIVRVKDKEGVIHEVSEKLKISGSRANTEQE